MPKSKDLMSQDLQVKLAAALESESTESVAKVFVEFADQLQQDILADAEAYRQTEDNRILAERGVRVLTSEEKEYYDKFIQAARSEDPRSAVTNITVALPETVMDAVTEDIIAAFPLLDAVDFQNVGAIHHMIVNAATTHAAIWGALNSHITEELTGAITKIDVTRLKLTAYMAISQDMLLEGPAWVDAYVRAVLAESLGLGLCAGIVNGSGVDQPVGMLRNLAGNFNSSTGYPAKTKTAVTKLDVETFGEIAAKLAVSATGRPRTIDEILIVVNPADYFGKILPASTFLTTVGTYAHDVFPFPTKIVQDVNVPANTAIMGIGKNYKMFVGTGGKAGRIEYSDEFKFLDDDRYYKVKTYANGRPLDNTSFEILNITNLEALSGVKVVINNTTGS